MIDFFSSIELDKQSFWLGFVAGAIFLWFIIRLRRYLPQAIITLRQKIREAREGLTSNAELRYRNETLFQMQKMHITSPMFSLDEIVIPPKILVPSVPLDPENETLAENIITLTIPYLPDWPELAAKYNAATISLTEALSNGANLTIIGQPGSGRTVALAYLATLLIRREINNSALNHLLPIYLHALEIANTGIDIPPVDRIVKITSRYLSLITQQRLPSLLHSSFEKNRALLLIDGMDEVSATQYQIVLDFLREVLNTHPKVRIVITSSPENITGLAQLGFIPVSLASWDEEMIDAFLQSFSRQWRKLINSNDHPKADQFYNLLILSWLESHNYPQGPLELTLRIWSAFAGDILGPDFCSNIEAYVRRTTSGYPEAIPILAQITTQALLDQKLTIDQEDIRTFLEKQGNKSNVDLKVLDELPATESSTSEQEAVKQAPPRDLKIESMFQQFKRNGLLNSLDDQVYRYSHPIIACFLAGSAVSKIQDLSSVLEQNDWAGKKLAIAYYLQFNKDGGSIVDLYLDQERDDILYRKILNAARWLKYGNSEAQWRQKLMRTLAVKLQSESVTLALSSRFLLALALTYDAHVAPLFRQFLFSEDANIRQLAALGCGLIKDTKSVPELAKLINDDLPGVSRAACLALVSIGDKNSLETVATVLLQGGETVKRYAAEALANHREEGHPALRDASKMEDLLVRRAVVFGLARINETWAEKILEDLQLEDQQWLVRNAAIQALEDRKNPKPFIPLPPEPLTDVPWLIEFASKLGIGVVPGKPAIDLLIRALRDGDEGLRLVALNYLRINCIEEVIPAVYEVYQSSLGDVREAAFDTLWHMSASGMNINIQS